MLIQADRCPQGVGETKKRDFPDLGGSEVNGKAIQNYEPHSTLPQWSVPGNEELMNE